jgi:hypothetical protein
MLLCWLNKCSLPPTTQPIQQLFLQNEDETKQSFEKKTLLQLKDIDPFTEKVCPFYSYANLIKSLNNKFYR